MTPGELKRTNARICTSPQVVPWLRNARSVSVERTATWKTEIVIPSCDRRSTTPFFVVRAAFDDLKNTAARESKLPSRVLRSFLIVANPNAA